MGKILGSSTVSNVTASADYLYMGRWQATVTAELSAIIGYCEASGLIRVGVYADSAGSPGALLSRGSRLVPVSPGWNIANVPPITVTSGTYYWLAGVGSAAGTMPRVNTVAGTTRYKTWSHLNDLPNPAGTGFSSPGSVEQCLSGWTAVPALGTELEGTNGWAGNYLHVGKFTARYTGRITRILVYSSASGFFKAGIYQDSGGEPGARLAVNNYGAAAVAGRYNSINLTSPYLITGGNDYWIVALGSTSSVLMRNTSGSSYPHRYKSNSYESGIPNPAGTGFSNSTTEDAFRAIVEPPIGFMF